MSQMRRFAQRLAPVVGRSPGFIHALCHLAGTRGSVCGVVSLLQGVTAHLPELHYLSRAYPACLPWVKILAVATEISDAALLLPRGSDEGLVAPGQPDALGDGVSRANFASFVHFILPVEGGSPRPEVRLLKAAAFLEGVMRQASHEGAVDEDGPHSWLDSVVDSAHLLSAMTLDWPSGESLGQLDLFEAVIAALVAEPSPGELELRLAANLTKLRKLFRSKGAATLGLDIEEFFLSAERESVAIASDPGADQSDGVPSAPAATSPGGDGSDEDEIDPDDGEIDLNALDEEVQDGDDRAEPDDDDETEVIAGEDSRDGKTRNRTRGPGRWGNKPSSVLPESMLLPEHSWALDPPELMKLSANVDASLSQPSIVAAGCRPLRSGFYEGIVVGIALAAAQTIEGSCAIRLVRERADSMLEAAKVLPRSRYLRLESQPTDRAVAAGVGLWFPPGDRFRLVRELDEESRLDLPAVLAARIQQLSGNIIDAELQELLPFVPEGWARRTHLWLHADFGRAVGPMNLAIRHALARELYAATASRAMLDLACGGPSTKDKTAQRHVALSTYVYPGNRRNRVEFIRAATSLVTPGERPTDEVGRPSICYIAADTLQHIAGKLRAAAEQPAPTRLDGHYAIAIYTASMLHAGTGHRHSLRPLHFPWDLDLKAMIAFICDKLKVGSEARFVPLARALVAQLQVYRRHVASLILELQPTRPELARRIAQAAGMSYQGDRVDSNTDGAHPVGQFFTIHGDALHAIDAKAIDEAMRGALSDWPWPDPVLMQDNPRASIVRLLRKNLATYLWTAGASGVQVEAWLGHNRDWHVHGMASTWSVLRDATRVRPAIDQYLVETGWMPVDEKALGRLSAVPPLVVPLAVLGIHGYEGRERAADQAYARARAVVHDELVGEFDGRKDQIVLDDNDIGRIRAAVIEVLGNDRRAHDKVLEVFGNLSAKWRRGGSIRISASQVNRIRCEAGPVEVGFARDLAIANAIRAAWPGAVSKAIEAANSSRQDIGLVRLAVILGSFVVQDGILDPQQLWPLLESTHAREARNALGRIQLRAEVETRSAIFVRVVYLTRLTSAAVRGFCETADKHPHAGLDRGDVEQVLAEIVGRIVPAKSKRGWTLPELARVFRAWWFVRLPGFLYAVAIGQVAAPSADEISEATLLGGTPPRLGRLGAQRSRQSKMPKAEQESAAEEAIKDLFDKAEGRHVDANQASRAQRQRLRRLFDRELPQPLPALMSEHPILEVRVRFIEYLLVTGGMVKEHLAFNTIKDYDSRLGDLYRRCWTMDPRDMSADEFDEVYAPLIDASKYEAPRVKAKGGTGAAPVLLMTALRTFHLFLRTTYRVPPSSVVGLPLGLCRQRRARSALLAPRLVRALLASVGKATKGVPAQGNGAAAVLLSGQAFGTRRKEALCVMVRDFDRSGRHLRLRVRSNAANKIKNTRAGRRVIPWPLAAKRDVQLLRGAIESEAATAQKDRYLLADPSGTDELLEEGAMMSLVNATLKAESGNPALVYHGLRHGYGTGALCAVSAPVGDVKPCIVIRREMSPDTEVADAVAALRPNREQWPFFVGRAAMWHGAGLETVLNTYFHGGGWMLAEHADACADDSDVSAGVWATLMGMTRTNPTKLKTGWKQSEGAGADTSWERIVRHFVDVLKLPSACAVDPIEDEPAAILHEQASSDAYMTLTFAMADKLLVRMRREGLSIEQAIEKARDEHALDPEIVARFLGAKDHVVKDTGLLSFEVQEADAPAQSRASREGVWRNSVRRQEFLARIEVLALDEQWRSSLVRMTDEWQRWVNSRQPMLVVRSEERLLDVLNLLSVAGIEAAHLKVKATASVHVGTAFAKSWAAQYDVSRGLESRFSRGDKAQSVEEFGIVLNDGAPSLPLRNADLHRAMVTVAAVLRVAESPDGPSPTRVVPTM